MFEGPYVEVLHGISKKKENWRAQIVVNGVQIHLGYFEDDETAALNWDAAASSIPSFFAVGHWWGRAMPSCHFAHLILLSSGPKVPKSGPFKNEGIHEMRQQYLYGANTFKISISYLVSVMALSWSPQSSWRSKLRRSSLLMIRLRVPLSVVGKYHRIPSAKPKHVPMGDRLGFIEPDPPQSEIDSEDFLADILLGGLDWCLI
jgi:hypothetical protein